MKSVSATEVAEALAEHLDTTPIFLPRKGIKARQHDEWGTLKKVPKGRNHAGFFNL